MAAKSTTTKYGTVAVTIHWLSALLILVLVGSGFRASGLEDAAAKAAVLRFHVPVGILILLLTLARIGWWLFGDRRPQSLPMPRWQERLSRLVHILFYVVILGMTASGIGMMVLSGAGPLIFADVVDRLPDFWDYRPRIPHGFGARFIVVLFVLHAGAALYHHFVKRDALLGRMWFGKS